MQDKRGRWWIDYRTPEGRRRRKLYGTHDAAKTALAKIDLAKKDRTYTDPHASPTFTEFSETYLKTVSVHKKSYDRETWFIKSLVAFFGGSKLCKIERARVLEFRLARLKTVSKATVNRELSVLRHMFNVAIDQNIVATNPARAGIGMKAFKEQGRDRLPGNERGRGASDGNPSENRQEFIGQDEGFCAEVLGNISTPRSSWRSTQE